MALVVGCGVTGCGGHPSFTAAHEHARRTGLFGVPPTPDPREDPGAYAEACRVDAEAASWDVRSE